MQQMMQVTGKLLATIDLTEMTSKLTFSEDAPKYHNIELIVIDNDDRFVAQNIQFVVNSKRHKTVNALVTASEIEGSNNILFKGILSAPLYGSSFVYKVAGATEWILVDPSDVIKHPTDGTYTSTVTLPYANYIFSTAVIVDGAIVEQGDVHITVRSSQIVDIPNLSFDSWHADGKNWYPNKSGYNSYWASGNEGATMGGGSITVPVDDVAVVKEGGKAVRMFSKKVIGVFAAGNLFTGTYKTNIGNPIESVKLGREYTGRPTRLTGYYKYKNGGGDACHIFIKLENRTLGKVVAYGEISDDKNSTEYIPFAIDIKYNEEFLDMPITHVTIVATSSIKGDQFIGTVGSELFVDEFAISHVYQN